VGVRWGTSQSLTVETDLPHNDRSETSRES
jgi:hypothetical protein